MAENRMIDPAGREAVLAAVVAENPEAFIAAMAPTGFLVPLPDELAATGLRPIEGPASLLGVVVGEDHVTALDAWHQLLAEGVGECLVRPVAAPDRQVRLHLIDLTHRLGVHAGLITGMAGGLAGPALAHDEVRPRLVTMRKDQNSVITDIGPEVAPLLGRQPEELAGTRSLDLVHPDDRERSIASWMDLLSAGPGAVRRVRLRHLHRDGTTVWFEITNHNRLGDPERPAVIAEMLDISDEMAAQEAVRAAEQLMRRLTETLPMGVLQLDAGRRINYLNERAARALHARLGDPVDGLLDAIAPADRPAAAGALAEVLGTGRDVDLEYGTREPGRPARRMRANLRALTDEAGAVTGAIICLTDVTEDVRLREELRHRATFDELTGCHNRAATMAALHDAVQCADAGAAVVFLDLNSFKQVNDRYGHAAGDQLLVHVAARLRLAVPYGGLLGRIGGDEFVVICRDVPSPADAHRIGAALLASLAGDGDGDGIRAAGEVLRPQASMGIAWSPCGASDPEELIARADAAMYEAKKSRTGPLAVVLA
ncbi:diguanylate cyclase domain-containing protein [Actinoplanes sp. CA-030573]|uniref:diguanylate cyclase domain-containing protein n=1 Tax=Actinoplanes sp. CA-030573 TaxID=3239898 RepID=UPI003D91A4FB